MKTEKRSCETCDVAKDTYWAKECVTCPNGMNKQPTTSLEDAAKEMYYKWRSQRENIGEPYFIFQAMEEFAQSSQVRDMWYKKFREENNK